MSMSIEHISYCDPVEGLNSWSSLTIKVISFAQRHQFLLRSHLYNYENIYYIKVREMFDCFLGKDTCVNVYGSHDDSSSLS